MWKASIILCLVSLSAVSGEWTCSRDDVVKNSGKICCNKEVGAMMAKEMEKGSTKAAAVAIRKNLQSVEGGLWEVIVSKCDFGFANYVVGTQHCKVEANGRTALAWKVLGGGSSSPAKDPEATTASSATTKPTTKSDSTKPTEATTKASTDVTTTKAPATTEKSTTKGASSKKTPNEKLKECCQQQNVASICFGGEGYANLCDFNEYTIPNVIKHYFNQGAVKGCPGGDLGKVLQCAAQGADHTDCCEAQKLSGVAGLDWKAAAKTCDLFCYPAANLRAPATGPEFACGTGDGNKNLEKIKDCFIVYSKTGKIYKPS